MRVRVAPQHQVGGLWMARTILGLGAEVSTPLENRTVAPSRATITGPQLRQALRRPRSAGYVTALGKMDVAGHQVDKAAQDTLVAAIAAEFPDLTIQQRPLGIVCKCFLGSPYVVHICDLDLNIVEHFEHFRSMPQPYERARPLALHPSYAFIEVYADSLRAIAADGSVSVIE